VQSTAPTAIRPAQQPPDANEPATRTPAIVVTVVAGASAGQFFELAPGRYTVGTSATCDITVDDPFTSRRHLELFVGADGVHALDLGSRNGSFFELGRFTELVVQLGSEIMIGATRLRITAPPALEAASDEPTRFGSLVGRSPQIREVFGKLHRLSHSDSSLLIDGETGTGKELCAKAVHDASHRRNGPFVVCDLAAMPRSLIESELFGHVRGAFTGADRDRVGAFAHAGSGTILLDEIGELPLDAQPVLLRALENRTIKPLGTSRAVPVDVRVIATTHRDLAREVEAGRFRADLYYRLSVFRVTLPPLRERREDIPLLVEAMLEGKRLVVSDRAHAALRNHDWPGNVRELRNAIDRALSTSTGVADPECFGIAPTLGSSDRPDSFRDARSLWEREYVARLIERTQGNVAKAAREAGLGRTHLYQLMRKHGFTANDVEMECTTGGRTLRLARGSQKNLK